MNRIEGDFDLIELLENLWQGKAIIFAVTAFCIGLSSLWWLSIEKRYESKMVLDVGTIPYYKKAKDMISNFESEFTDQMMFNKWKADTPNAIIQFEEFSQTVNLDGFLMTRKRQDRLATIERNKKTSYILVKSSNLEVLQDFYRYGQYIARSLTENDLLRIEAEMALVESAMSKQVNLSDDSLGRLLSLKRYILSAERGASALKIQRPTKPVNVAPSPIWILLITSLIGLFASLLFVSLQAAFRKRRQEKPT